eukprot:GHVT01027934.1.p1 GENE.GHVT01027934.1~~GHVT01027934.1.p1  ORF type:complete len:119 (+),score=21.99 GHVT01027934.1:406-762(+)
MIKTAPSSSSSAASSFVPRAVRIHNTSHLPIYVSFYHSSDLFCLVPIINLFGGAASSCGRIGSCEFFDFLPPSTATTFWIKVKRRRKRSKKKEGRNREGRGQEEERGQGEYVVVNNRR